MIFFNILYFRKYCTYMHWHPHSAFAWNMDKQAIFEKFWCSGTICCWVGRRREAPKSCRAPATIFNVWRVFNKFNFLFQFQELVYASLITKKTYVFEVTVWVAALFRILKRMAKITNLNLLVQTSITIISCFPQFQYSLTFFASFCFKVMKTFWIS